MEATTSSQPPSPGDCDDSLGPTAPAPAAGRGRLRDCSTCAGRTPTCTGRTNPASLRVRMEAWRVGQVGKAGGHHVGLDGRDFLMEDGMKLPDDGPKVVGFVRPV